MFVCSGQILRTMLIYGPQLAPYFSDYIKDLVNNNPDNEQLANAMEDLVVEHEIFLSVQ
jgi:hypothetical protein